MEEHMDVDELKALLEDATATALQIGDELAHAAKITRAPLPELAARYEAARGEIRRLRRALTVEVAG